MQKCANKHGVTVHSFRRTYAYLLKTQGIHVTTAQKLLGHSDPMMTLRVYTSVLDSEIDDAGVNLRLKVFGGFWAYELMASIKINGPV